MARNAKVAWGLGAVFGVPLADGTLALGQVTDLMMPNVVYCAFTNVRTPTAAGPVPTLQADAVIAALAVTREQLDFGAWPLVGSQAVVWPRERFTNERFRQAKWVGAMIEDAAIAEDLLAAYFGFRVWDEWHDPEYLDKLLLRPELRPSTVRLKRSGNVGA